MNEQSNIAELISSMLDIPYKETQKQNQQQQNGLGESKQTNSQSTSPKK